MPIYEYVCESCSTKFEKLIRRESDLEQILCPNCGQEKARRELSTFAPRMGASKSAGAAPMCPSGGMCPTPGKCGLN